MATTRGNERIRFRYGICLNDQCSKCKTKEVQEIPARKELVCTECGKPLRECPPPPPTDSKKKLIAIIAVAVVLIGGGVAIALSGGDKESTPPTEIDTTTVETTPVDTAVVETPAEEPKVEEPKVEPPKKEDPAPAPAPKNPSWGKYEGARDASGLPHGNGILRITRSTTINGETAQPGERIEGVFRNGYVNMGTWYKNDGNVVVVKDVRVF